MPLVKGSSARMLADEAIVLDLGDLRRQAAAIIEAAREEADRIKAGARRNAEKIVDDATSQGIAAGRELGLQEGREQGLREGREEAKREHGAQLAALGTAWGEALERFERERHAMLEGLHDDVVRLAIRIAERVLQRIPQIDPAAALPQVREALALVTGVSRAVIVMHPDDLPAVQASLSRVLEAVGHAGEVVLQEDAGMRRGGVVVRTAGGEIDARIETQLGRIAEALVPGETESP